MYEDNRGETRLSEGGVDIGAIKGKWPKYIAYNKKETRVANFYSDKGNEGARNKKQSFFHGKTGLDIFMMAMALGKDIGTPTSIPSGGRANNLPTSSLNDENMWAMISVALAEKDSNLDTLSDGTKIYEICEGYANTGILPLITLDETGEIGNYQKHFEDKFKKYIE